MDTPGVAPRRRPGAESLMAAGPTLLALTGPRFFAALHVVLVHFAAPVAAPAVEAPEIR
jgi:peptidoglycan/LPS O-acetylase OafA/YrhL